MLLDKILIPTAILLAPAAVTAAATTKPVLRTNQACYLVNQRVAITGSGFAPTRLYEVAVDGQNFGTSTTDANGGFNARLTPGGLPANTAQFVHRLAATDGTSTAQSAFTVTRTTGARVLIGTGPAASVRARFEVWGFALKNRRPQPPVPGRPPPPVYVHYLGPGGNVKGTVALGHAGGQCGYVETAARHLFPFGLARGVWTLQVDSNRRYSAFPAGPSARFTVRVS